MEYKYIILVGIIFLFIGVGIFSLPSNQSIISGNIPIIENITTKNNSFNDANVTAIWNHTPRTLTNWNQTIINYIYSHIGGSLTYSGVWSYSPRTLTNWNNTIINTIINDITSNSPANWWVYSIHAGFIPSNITNVLGKTINDIKTHSDYIPSNIATLLGYIPSTLSSDISTIKTDVGYIPSDTTTQLDTNIPAIETKTNLITAQKEIITFGWEESIGTTKHYIYCANTIGIGVTGSTTEFGNVASDNVFNYWVAPSSMVLTNFGVGVTPAPSSGKSITITVRDNGVDTLATITISNTAVQGSYTGSINISAGDKISVSIVGTSGQSTAGGIATIALTK